MRAVHRLAEKHNTPIASHPLIQPSMSPRSFPNQGRQTAPIPLPRQGSRRRARCADLRIGLSAVTQWGIAFALIMFYIFLHAATLANNFRARQMDKEISLEESSLHEDYSRLALFTSPEQARKVALAHNLMKIMPEQVDSWNDSTQHIASKEHHQGQTEHSIAAASPSVSDAHGKTDSVRIVLASP